MNKAIFIACALGVANVESLLDSHCVASPLFDAINGDATPAGTQFNVVHFGRSGIGWFYTPPVNYYLDEIRTRFSARLPSASTTPQNVTVRIHTDSPAFGGTLLGDAEFTVVPLNGGLLGGSFPAVLLHANQQYFVSFVGIENLGINLAGWNGPLDAPQLTGGATTVLPSYFYPDDGVFDEPLTGGFSTVTISPNGNYVNVALRAPILLFHGYAIPEPSTLCMSAIVLASGGLRVLGSRSLQRGKSDR